MTEKGSLTGKKKQKQQTRDNFFAAHGFKSTTLGSARLSQVAAMREPVWPLLLKIFKEGVPMGPVDGKGNKKMKKPTSIANFIHMANVPTELILKWLNRVIQGQITFRQFELNCKQHKKLLHMKECIVEFVNNMFVPEEYPDFEELAERYECFKDTGWIAQLLGWFGNTAKSTLSAAAKEAISTKCNNIRIEEKEKEEEQPDVSVF